MAYSTVLEGSQQLAIANPNGQTQINLTTSSPQQQQNQSSSFNTGSWREPPKLYRLDAGFILKIDTNQKQHYILIQHHSLSTIEAPADLDSYPQLALDRMSDYNSEQISPMKPMKPMKPMQPLKMGNMSMDLNSMSMQMGNMQMGFKNSPNQTKSKFCSQCGAEAKASDRFCSSCGHELGK